MATVELGQPAEYLETDQKPPAIQILDFIQNFQFPETEASSQTDEVFLDLHLGRVFAAIIEEYGEVTVNSAGLKLLRGSDGKEWFIAKHFPAKQQGGQASPGSVHITIHPHAPFEEQLYTIPITLPESTGIPIVRYNHKKARHGNPIIGEQMPPDKAFAQVQRLSGLVKGAVWAKELERSLPSD